MSEADDRVRDALSAHLEHLELGGPEPDVSHLTPEELERLHDLIALLDQTEGVALGRGLGRAGEEAVASTEAGEGVVEALREAMPPASRIAVDPAATTLGIPGIGVDEAWTVGTFGGRIRVWLLAEESALAASEGWLRDLERVFRQFPDTAALALVEGDLSCLLVQPEDCAPTIQVPRGSLIARRYRRPVVPLGQALAVFLRELVPYWEPMRSFDEQVTPAIEVEPVARERAITAIQEQAAAGARARKANPKRKALTELGEREAGELAGLTLGIHEGRLGPDDVEQAVRRLATKR